MTATEIRTRITKLSAMTEARGASSNEAAMARKAILRLQAKLPQDDVKVRAQPNPAFTDNFIFTWASQFAWNPDNWRQPDDMEVRPDDLINAMRNWSRSGTMRTRRHAR